MQPKIGETIVLDLITSAATGAAADADAVPTCEVFEDDTDVAVLSPVVVKRTGKAGNYRVSIACTTLGGFDAGKSYNAIVTATIGGVAGCKAMIGRWQVRAVALDDVLRATPTAADGATYAVDTGLPAAVTTAVWSATERALTATGLDAITATEPTAAIDGAMSSWNFRKLLRWGVMRMARGTKNGSSAIVVRTLNGTTSTTQAISVVAGVETLEGPT